MNHDIQTRRVTVSYPETSAFPRLGLAQGDEDLQEPSPSGFHSEGEAAGSQRPSVMAQTRSPRVPEVIARYFSEPEPEPSRNNNSGESERRSTEISDEGDERI